MLMQRKKTLQIARIARLIDVKMQHIPQLDQHSLLDRLLGAVLNILANFYWDYMVIVSVQMVTIEFSVNVLFLKFVMGQLDEVLNLSNITV